MKQILLSTLVILLTLTSMSAQKIKGNGKVKTETRVVGEFDKINVNGSFDVVLVKGKEGSIMIKGESNITPLVMVEVKEGTLKIFAKKGTNFYSKKPLIITVPFSEIDGVCLNGSGDITSDAIVEANDLEITLDGSGDIELSVKASALKSSVMGSGDIELSGSTKELNAKVTGSGDFDALDLDSHDTKVSVVGSGDAHVVAKGSITAKVTGSGDISYKGKPTNEKVSVIGSGDITKL